MSQKVESLVACGGIRSSNQNNGTASSCTTFAGIHQMILKGSIASPKGQPNKDGNTALFQYAEAPGRLNVLGFSYLRHWSQPDSDTACCKCQMCTHQIPNTCSSAPEPKYTFPKYLL